MATPNDWACFGTTASDDSSPASFDDVAPMHYSMFDAESTTPGADAATSPDVLLLGDEAELYRSGSGFGSISGHDHGHGRMSDAEFQWVISGLGQDADAGAVSTYDTASSTLGTCVPSHVFSAGTLPPQLPLTVSTMEYAPLDAYDGAAMGLGDMAGLSMPVDTLDMSLLTMMPAPSMDFLPAHPMAALSPAVFASSSASPWSGGDGESTDSPGVPGAAGSAGSPASASASASASAPAPSHRCRTCPRSYPTASRLRKHERTHTRPFVCAVCDKGHAAKKDLERHMWTTHQADAERLQIPNPVRRCPAAGCDYEGRQDNLTRHMQTRHAGM